MMSNPDHASVREQMEAALANGLRPAERAAFDAHLETCVPCAADWADMKRRDADLAQLFSDARPTPGFEDRLIRSLRQAKPQRTWVHPTVRRAATGVAAALLLASAGYVVSSASNGGRMLDLFAIGDRVRNAPSLRGIAAAAALYSNENRSEYGFAEAAPVFDAPSSNAERDDLPAKDAIAKRNVDDVSTNLAYRLQQTPVSTGGSGLRFKNAAEAQAATGSGPKHQSAAGNTWDKDPALAVPAAPGQQPPPHAPAAKKPADYFFRQEAAKAGQATGGIQLGRPVILADAFKPAELAKETSGEAQQKGEALEEVKVGDTVEFSLKMQTAQGQRGGGDGQHLFGGVHVAQVPPTPPLVPAAPPQAPAAPSRKVIRSGAMEFEVDRFDAALAMITKLAQEAGGYVGTTDSEKLPNGKVKGTVVVRVPPDRLDTLVTQLRGIGDLRSQKMDAQDVTKQYTDLEGELRAARAMEERLLEIIKTGKGEIKDLLAAEKELGVWRTKIEKMVGEMRYYDNLVSLTTLTITAFERDIRNAATARETETVQAGIETDDVESARAAALKAIEEAKGRVIQSDLKRHDAGQFSAQVVADVSPDAAGVLVDRLKQLGKVARFEVQRKQTTPEGTTQPAAGARLERAETRINLSLYNLANVAPRQTTNLNLAAADVEAAHKAIAARVAKATGRIVTSSLSRPQAEQVVGSIHFEVRAADAEAVLGDVRGLGEVMRLTVTENPDTNNVTTAKQGFVVQLASVASVPARESTNLQLAATDVAAAFNALRDAVRATPARVTTSQLNEAVRENVTATLDFEVMRGDLPAVEEAIRKLGDVTQRTSGRSGDTENTVDSKVRMQMSFVDADQLPPRETTALGVETTDPDKALADLQSLATGAGARVVQSNLSQERGGQTIGKLVVDVPLANSVELITRAKGQGSVRMVQSTKDAQGVDGSLARARVDMTFSTSAGIVAPDQGLWASIRRGLATSMTGLMWSLQLIIIGLCFVGPWVIAIWLAWRFLKRRRGTPTTPATA